MATPGEVRIVVRSVWQGLLDWWNPPGDSAGIASASSDCGIEIERSAHSHSAHTAERTPPGVAQKSETSKRAHLVDVSRRDTDTIDPTDEELMEFLAADHEPVEADPEFKRKLRDQLWTLVQGNELTRQ
jgi:hypothetical protein